MILDRSFHACGIAITVDQMREVDRLMVEVYGIGLVQMMEHAGRNLAELARMLLGGAKLAGAEGHNDVRWICSGAART